MNLAGISIRIKRTNADGGLNADVYNGDEPIGEIESHPVRGSRGAWHGTTYVAHDWKSGRIIQVCGSLEGACEAIVNARLSRIVAGATG